MASRRKPLEDARRRVNEKLFDIGEQTEFIVQSVRQLSCGVSCLKMLILERTRTVVEYNKK